MWSEVPHVQNTVFSGKSSPKVGLCILPDIPSSEGHGIVKKKEKDFSHSMALSHTMTYFIPRGITSLET
jgi:hypothetical protein